MALAAPKLKILVEELLVGVARLEEERPKVEPPGVGGIGEGVEGLAAPKTKGEADALAVPVVLGAPNVNGLEELEVGAGAGAPKRLPPADGCWVGPVVPLLVFVEAPKVKEGVVEEEVPPKFSSAGLVAAETALLVLRLLPKLKPVEIGIGLLGAAAELPKILGAVVDELESIISNIPLEAGGWLLAGCADVVVVVGWAPKLNVGVLAGAGAIWLGALVAAETGACAPNPEPAWLDGAPKENVGTEDEAGAGAGAGAASTESLEQVG